MLIGSLSKSVAASGSEQAPAAPAVAQSFRLLKLCGFSVNPLEEPQTSSSAKSARVAHTSRFLRCVRFQIVAQGGAEFPVFETLRIFGESLGKAADFESHEVCYPLDRFTVKSAGLGIAPSCCRRTEK